MATAWARFSTRSLASGLTAAALGALACLQTVRPLRVRREPALQHAGRNAAVAVLAAVVLALLEAPILRRVTDLVARRRWGLAPRLRIGPWQRAVATFLVLDYTLYIWHVLLHRVPLLWRFHSVHHADRDLTFSTAFRFHFGELALSIPWRVLQVAIIGPPRPLLQTWQRWLMVSVAFHHANLRLPEWFERPLARLLMTPRLHGLHHATAPHLQRSNWSSGLTLWDALHGTLRPWPGATRVEVGLADFTSARAVGLRRMLLLPFLRNATQPPSVNAHAPRR